MLCNVRWDHGTYASPGKFRRPVQGFGSGLRCHRDRAGCQTLHPLQVTGIAIVMVASLGNCAVVPVTVLLNITVLLVCMYVPLHSQAWWAFGPQSELVQNLAEVQRPAVRFPRSVVKPHLQPVVLAAVPLDGKKRLSRQGGALQVDAYVPARVVQGADGEALAVLPAAVALRGVPSLQPRQDPRGVVVEQVPHGQVPPLHHARTLAEGGAARRGSYVTSNRRRQWCVLRA